MKRLVALMICAVSFGAAAQSTNLPYNPDANNDGLIGAFDLTSLLSVYSGNFSNGILGEGTAIVGPPPLGISYIICTGFSSYVVDLYQFVPDVFASFPQILVYSPMNGTTVSIIIPESGIDQIFISSLKSDEVFPSDDTEIDLFNKNNYAGNFTKLVYWNGVWHQSF